VKNGLTLIEVVLAAGIAAIIGVLLLVIIINSAGLYSKEASKVSQGLNNNDALNMVRKSIKESSAVAAQYVSGSTTYTSGTTQLILKLPSIDSSNNIIPNTTDYFVFFLDTTKLRLKVFPDNTSSRKSQDQIFSTSVNSLNFQYFNLANPPLEVTAVNALKVRISLTLRQKNGQIYETSTATSEANLRND